MTLRVSLTLLGFACSIVLADAPATGPATRPIAQQTQKAFEVRQEVRYLQYLPRGYADDPTNAREGGRGWPLVMFLHGSGQRGTDLNVVKQEGLPRLVAEGREYPFILISPQINLRQYYNTRDLIQLLDRVEQTLHVDKDRIYVTGLSMGGYGTWDMADAAGDRLAAIIPICGGGNPAWPAREISAKTLAVWAFHGTADDAVPAMESERMIEALKAVGNKNAGLTLYPGVGHLSWRIAYDDPHLFEWMLAQRRQPPATQPAK